MLFCEKNLFISPDQLHLHIFTYVNTLLAHAPKVLVEFIPLTPSGRIDSGLNLNKIKTSFLLLKPPEKE